MKTNIVAPASSVPKPSSVSPPPPPKPPKPDTAPTPERADHFERASLTSLKPMPVKEVNGLTLIPLTGYQQTKDYTCGPASVVTVLSYFGFKGDKLKFELQLEKELGTTEEHGTKPEAIAKWLSANGLDVRASFETKKDGKVQDIPGSIEQLRENLGKGIPTIIEWSDWGGHYAVVVGYDTHGSDDWRKHELILADSYDRVDNQEDGLTRVNPERFASMWYDAQNFGSLRKGIWITAVPKSK